MYDVSMEVVQDYLHALNRDPKMERNHYGYQTEDRESQ